MPRLHAIPSAARTSDDLVRRLARGEAAAVGEAYDLHHERIRAFARRVLGDDATAEDVVQEVFLALPKAARRFRGDSSLRSYLLGIAARRCHKHRRSAARRARAMGRLAEEPPPAGGVDPERETRRVRLAAALQRGLSTLSVDHRVVFVLAAVEERSSPEVSEILGIPEGTVRTRLFHARKRLRAFLTKEGIS